MGNTHRAFLAATLCGALATPALAADATMPAPDANAAQSDAGMQKMAMTTHHHAARHRAGKSENQAEVETTRQLNEQAAKDAMPSQ